MRLLKRQSDEGEAAVDGDQAVDTERPTAETDRVVEERDAEPSHPGVRHRLRRKVTVPMTVPRRSVRRTMTVPSRRIHTPASERSWPVASIAAAAAGAVLAVIGIVAVIRAGLNETWFAPEVEVLRADHTPLLGALQVGAGVLLLVLGLAGSRLLVAVAGIAGALLCTAAAVEPEELARELAIESWWAWVLAGAGVALTLLALYEPRQRTRNTVIDVR
ncbi:MAG: hypothetical protein ACRD2C_12910 [Acidimicrobiales bacterium]